MIDKLTEDRIKATANIVDVVGDFVQLKKSGVEYLGLCPFHDDRHLGSFKVNPTKQMYYCFSCGKGGDAVEFLMNILGLNYADALKWLAKKYGIMVEGADDLPAMKPIMRPKRVQPQMLTISKEVVKSTLDTEQDTLCTWLRTLPWSAEQKERVEQVLWLYAVGHWQDGRVVFWQVDESGRVRSGKLMRYGDNGKRVRTENPGWVHHQLSINMDLYEFQCCMFGQHLLRKYPKATVNVVESEKTALVCSIAYGDWEKNIWLACGGEQWLRKTLAPIAKQKRTIYLWPDVDGAERWEGYAAEMGSRVSVYNDWIERDWKEEDGAKADIADVLVRLISENLRDKMIEKNPALGKLLNQLERENNAAE